MPRANVNGIELEYEMFGDEAAPPLLLVMGLGAQMIAWEDGFCTQLAAKGYRVIRFDNRDVGLSTKTDGPLPDIMACLGGDASSANYLLQDMADDAVGLLDVLGIRAAHVVGASMGGMIAQTIAIRHPDRVLSLCSIMSTTGAPDVGAPTSEAMQELLRPVSTNKEDYLEASVRSSKVIGSTGFPFDEERARSRAELHYERCYHPMGVARQLAAILASGDRTEGLANVTVPTVVIHGDADPLVTPTGGEATAKAVPGADHVVIEGMGHDLPEGAWPQVLDAITTNTSKVKTKEPVE
jgi:pimeloyl-ACP methyl ester carboxylesterase